MGTACSPGQQGTRQVGEGRDSPHWTHHGEPGRGAGAGLQWSTALQKELAGVSDTPSQPLLQC